MSSACGARGRDKKFVPIFKTCREDTNFMQFKVCVKKLNFIYFVLQFYRTQFISQNCRLRQQTRLEKQWFTLYSFESPITCKQLYNIVLHKNKLILILISTFSSLQFYVLFKFCLIHGRKESRCQNTFTVHSS
jgi:hypothetical protein